MDLKRITEIETKLAQAHPSEPVKTDAFEMRELLALAKQGIASQYGALRLTDAEVARIATPAN